MPLGAGEGGDERRRHHQVADAEAGEHHVREGADVDHRGRGAQALQRRQRRAAVVVFAVVVVLDHHDAAGPRPFEQLEPPRQRHRRAGRELVRRGDEDHARRVGQLGHRDAVALHRHGVQARPVRLEQLPRARVARILDRRDVARVDEHARTQIERLLRAVDHDDLAGLAPDGARPPQVRRDLAAQRLVAGAAIRRLPRRRRERAHVAHHEAAPDADREGLDVGAPFRQVERARRARRRRPHSARRPHGRRSATGGPAAARRRPRRSASGPADDPAARATRSCPSRAPPAGSLPPSAGRRRSSPSTATRAGGRRARAWTGSARPARSGRTGCRPATGRRSAGAAGSGRGGSGRSGPAWLSCVDLAPGPQRPGSAPDKWTVRKYQKWRLCAVHLPPTLRACRWRDTRAAVRPRPPTSCAGRRQERHESCKSPSTPTR